MKSSIKIEIPLPSILIGGGTFLLVVASNESWKTIIGIFFVMVGAVWATVEIRDDDDSSSYRKVKK